MPGLQMDMITEEQGPTTEMLGEQEPEGTESEESGKKSFREEKQGATTMANVTLVKIRTSRVHWTKLRRLFEVDRESPAIYEEIVKSSHIM